MNFLFKVKKSQKGQVLIESMVAISIGVMAVAGALSLLTGSLGSNNDLSQRAIGTYLAAEGIEVVKSLIDKNHVNGSAWNAGISNGSYEVQYNSSGLLNNDDRRLYLDLDTGVYSYSSSGAQTTFSRMIQINNISSNQIRVRSTVSWIERGGEINEITLEDHFFNWRSLLNT